VRVQAVKINLSLFMYRQSLPPERLIVAGKKIRTCLNQVKLNQDYFKC